MKKPSFRNLVASSFFILAILIPGCGGGGLGLLDLFGPNSSSGCGAIPALPNPQGLSKVRHIIVLMQENRSFDNYFGGLPYAPNTPYHPGPCASGDNTCVDGLTCTPNGSGDITCTNSNPDPNSTPVTAFHDPRLCVKPDLDHSWTGVHSEFNFADPNNSLAGMNDGFVAQNDVTGSQPDSSEAATDDDTMGFYTQADLPYYYALANTFAIDDRYFSSAPAPTIPNRMYELAGTSFGHVVTSPDSQPPLTPQYGYQPINGTIFDLLDKESTCWREYVEGGITDTTDLYGLMFRDPATTSNFMTLDDFLAQAGSGDLPEVAFLDLNEAHNEHPPDDVRAGEAEVARVITAVRNGPAWKSSIILLAWDEGGGFYDHVTPPAATPPDNIPPGMCADKTNPTPGQGANCSASATEAQKLCAKAMNGETCAGFNQYGIRLPFVIISPFAKPGYVSHMVDDHGSILRLIENRFLLGQNLTNRDKNANDLEDMLDFVNSPSLHLKVKVNVAPPALSSDPGCVGVTMEMMRARRP